MAEAAESISSANPKAADSLRSAYHRAPASASSSASSRNSISRRTTRRGVDTLTRFGPGNRRTLTRINPCQASVDLGRPGRLGIRIHFGVQALDKLPRQGSTLFSRKLKSLVK